MVDLTTSSYAAGLPVHAGFRSVTGNPTVTMVLNVWPSIALEGLPTVKLPSTVGPSFFPSSSSMINWNSGQGRKDPNGDVHRGLVKSSIRRISHPVVNTRVNLRFVHRWSFLDSEC